MLIIAKAMVFMTIICSIPNGKSMKEAWRLEKKVTLENCLTMNSVMSANGTKGAITVKCELVKDGL